MPRTHHLLAIALLAAGCTQLADFADDTADFADDDPMYAELDVGRPISAVRATSFGVAELTPVPGNPMPVVHVRMTVTNRHDKRPWKVDAVNAVLAVPGYSDSPVMFINTDIASVPIVRVERREVKVLDLYFPYPEGFDDAARPPPLGIQVTIETARRDFIWYARLAPANPAEPAAPPAGWAPYWWSDPTYAWPTFHRRSGRITPRVPRAVEVTRPPRWPTAPTSRIINRSSRGLAEIRLAPVAEQTWEPSVIAPLPAGAEQAIVPIACARYQVMFVDDDDRRCVLPMTQLCYGDEPWLIDDVTLGVCRWQR